MQPTTDTTTAFSNLTAEQLKSLQATRQTGDCILVLGPYVNIDANGQPVQTKLANFLADAFKAQCPTITDTERNNYGDVIGRLLLDGKVERGEIAAQINQFQGTQNPKIPDDSPYGLILEGGFKTIFNTDPDNRLMKAFLNNFDNPPLGVYLTLYSQPSISTFNGHTKWDVLDNNTPFIFNIFGLTTKDLSLAIGPEDELRQLNALASTEVTVKVSATIGDRLSNADWYMFVGFDFNSWAMKNIFYLFRKLAEELKPDPFILGLHSNPTVPLDDTTVIYYKNLFPDKIRDSVMLIDKYDAKAFFTDFANLPMTPPKKAFIYYAPNEQNTKNLLVALSDSLRKQAFEVQYSTPTNEVDPIPTPEEITQHIQQDELVLYLISPSWDGSYDGYLQQAQDRVESNPSLPVLGVLIDPDNQTTWPTPDQQKRFRDCMIVLNKIPLNLSNDDFTDIQRRLDGYFEHTNSL